MDFSIRTNFPDIKKQIADLKQISENFQFLSTLKENENLQPTTNTRSLIRTFTGYVHPIQKTLDDKIGIYGYFSDAYGQDSFDKVITHYQSEIYKASLVFKNAVDAIENFDSIEGEKECKIELINTGISAFWHLAAARIGFHEWTKTLAANFKNKPEEMNHRLKQINKILAQQNKVLTGIFKDCLCHFPKAMQTLGYTIDAPVQAPSKAAEIIEIKADAQAFYTEARNLANALKDMNVAIDSYVETKEERTFKKAAQEFVGCTLLSFIDDLEHYETELYAQEEDLFFEEKLQINAYKTLMPKAFEIRQAFNSIPQSFDSCLSMIDMLHCLFIVNKKSAVSEGVDFAADLISASIDADCSTRKYIRQLMPEEQHALFPKSSIQLWQSLVQKKMTSEFIISLKGIQETLKVIPNMETHVKKIEDLLNFFTLVANLTYRSLK